jgi:MFS family permease
VLSYSDKIFKGDHPTEDDENNAKIMTVVIGIILIIASYISGAIIDKFGRKIILVIGEATCIITLGILAICGY